MVLDGGPDGVLEQLGQYVLQRHLDVGEGGGDVTGNPDVWRVAVPLDGQLLGKAGPALNHFFQTHVNANDANVVRLRAERKKKLKRSIFQTRTNFLRPHKFEYNNISKS